MYSLQLCDFLTHNRYPSTVIPLGTSGKFERRDVNGGGGSEDSSSRWHWCDVDEVDTSYHVNETRLLTVSSFFKSQVGISISPEDQFTANASLYIMKQQPQLTGDRILVDRSTTVLNTWGILEELPPSCHYYLNPNSNVTVTACINNDCEPDYNFPVYIVKGTVTKKIVRPRKIILGQKLAMKFAPINVPPCQILSREGSHHDGGVQKAVARPSGCETSKWIASELRRSCGAGMSVLDGEAVPR